SRRFGGRFRPFRSMGLPVLVPPFEGTFFLLRSAFWLRCRSGSRSGSLGNFGLLRAGSIARFPAFVLIPRLVSVATPAISARPVATIGGLNGGLDAFWECSLEIGRASCRERG